MARPRKDSPKVDWTLIYEDWRTGKFSNAELARKYGLAASTVNNRVARDRWSMTSGPIPDPVITEPAEPTTPSRPALKGRKTKPAKVSDLLKRSTELITRLLAEVEDVTTYEGEISDIIIQEESDALRRRAALKAISVSERTKTVKELVTTLRMIQPGQPGRPRKDVPADDADQPQGKKAQRQAEAEKSAQTGPFAVPSPPKLVVNR